jgi:hypothetical protein
MVLPIWFLIAAAVMVCVSIGATIFARPATFCPMLPLTRVCRRKKVPSSRVDWYAPSTP